MEIYNSKNIKITDIPKNIFNDLTKLNELTNKVDSSTQNEQNKGSEISYNDLYDDYDESPIIENDSNTTNTNNSTGKNNTTNISNSSNLPNQTNNTNTTGYKKSNDLASAKALFSSLKAKEASVKTELENSKNEYEKLQDEIKEAQTKAESDYKAEQETVSKKAQNDFNPERDGDFNGYLQAMLGKIDFNSHLSTVNTLTARADALYSKINTLSIELVSVQGSLSKVSTDIQRFEAEEAEKARLAAEAAAAAQSAQASQSDSANPLATRGYDTAEGIAYALEHQDPKSSTEAIDIKYDESGRVTSYTGVIKATQERYVATLEYHDNNQVKRYSTDGGPIQSRAVVDCDENGKILNNRTDNPDGSYTISVGNSNLRNNEFCSYNSYDANGVKDFEIVETPNSSGGVDRLQAHYNADGTLRFQSKQVLDAKGQVVKEEISKDVVFKDPPAPPLEKMNNLNEEQYLCYKAEQLNQVKQEGRDNWTPEEVKKAFDDSGLSAQEHYDQYGKHEAVTPNGYAKENFNEEYYLENKVKQLNQTKEGGRDNWTVDQVKKAFDAAGVSSWEHYVTYGAKEGVDPSRKY